MSDPLDLLKATERARARRKILGGVEGARRREVIAANLDDTRTWVDPNGYRLSDRLWNARQADRDAIDNLLRESIARADDPIQTAKKLEAYLTPVGASQTTSTPRGGKGLYAARRLARTETTRAFGQATIEAAARARFPQIIRWRVSGRHDPRIDHGVCAHNQANGPYEPREVPRYPAHPNCRCTLQPYPKDDPIAIAEQLRRELQTPDLPERDPSWFREAPKTPAQQATANRLAQETARWLPKLTQAEVNAIDRYTTTAYRPLNRALRTGQELTPDQQQLVRNLDSALSKTQLQQSETFYRAVAREDVLYGLEVGQSTIDKGYVSTSIVPDAGFLGDRKVAIQAPAGTHAGYVHPFTQLGGDEVVLPRGLRYERVGDLDRFTPLFRIVQD